VRIHDRDQGRSYSAAPFGSSRASQTKKPTPKAIEIIKGASTPADCQLPFDPVVSAHTNKMMAADHVQLLVKQPSLRHKLDYEPVRALTPTGSSPRRSLAGILGWGGIKIMQTPATGMAIMAMRYKIQRQLANCARTLPMRSPQLHEIEGVT
jgi:hypothetical protein